MIPSQSLYKAKKVEIATKIATKTFGDANELAPFDWFSASPEGVAVSDVAGADEAGADAVGVEVFDGGEPALLRAAPISCGIINGLVPAAPRSIDPSSFITSALEARKLRVKRTFSATRG